jgi:hypothetical protein
MENSNTKYLSESVVSNNIMNADLFNKYNTMQIWLLNHMYMQYEK